MIEAWLGDWQQAALAESLRGSLWLYPLLNTAHLLGIALLIGPILVHDAAVLGLGSVAHRDALRAVMPRIAGGGLALALIAGVGLWLARPYDYAVHPVFQAKMAVLALALANIGFVHGLAGRLGPGALRAGAVVSAAAWLAVLLLGRLIGYR